MPEPADAVPSSPAQDRIERILLVVELVPRGRVVSYGDLAGVVETGPRQVGSVMSRHGSGLRWWRVVNASGGLPDHLIDEARAHWLAEGITTTAAGTRCRIAAHRADLVALAAAYDALLDASGLETSAQGA